MSDPKNKYEEWIDNLLSRRAIAATVLAFVVVGGFLTLWRPGKEFADDMGWTGPAPRAPAAQLPIGFVDPARAAPAHQSLELAVPEQSILEADGKSVVLFEYRGTDAQHGLDPDRPILVAGFNVRIQGREVSKELLGDYVRVESVYDRALVEGGRSWPLQVVEGDVLTLLGTHRFVIDRIWDSERLDRDFSDPSTTITLTTIR